MGVIHRLPVNSASSRGEWSAFRIDWSYLPDDSLTTKKHCFTSELWGKHLLVRINMWPVFKLRTTLFTIHSSPSLWEEGMVLMPWSTWNSSFSALCMMHALCIYVFSEILLSKVLTTNSLSSFACACMLSRLSRIRLFVTPWTLTCQAPLSMGFSRQEYWSGLLWPPSGDLSDSGSEPVSPTSPALAGEFFTSWATWEVLYPFILYQVKYIFW